MNALVSFYNRIPSWLYTSAFIVVPLFLWWIACLIARRRVRFWPFAVGAAAVYIAIAYLDINAHFHE